MIESKIVNLTDPTGDVSPERQATIDYLTTSLRALFPTNGVRVYTRRILGEQNIYLRYTHFTDKSQWSSGIAENDPAYMGFAIYNEHKKRDVWYIEHPNIHSNRIMGKGKSMSFRKISAKSEREAAEKLVAWFTKHQATIANIPQTMV